MYRIYTEDKNREATLKLVAASFDAFTVLEAQGYWRGTPERSIVIEIETENAKGVHKLARDIREANAQEAVLVQRTPSYSELVTADASDFSRYFYVRAGE